MVNDQVKSATNRKILDWCFCFGQDIAFGLRLQFDLDGEIADVITTDVFDGNIAIKSFS